MAVSQVEGYVKERQNDFFGKDGMQWWIGEVEDNQDPLQINRVKCRILGWYTDADGGSGETLPTDDLPWALVLQPTNQPGNDGQGQSSGQLQPGAIVLGFFLDGEEAQMPCVMGVLRTIKGGESRQEPLFALTGGEMRKVVNYSTAAGSNSTATMEGDSQTANRNNSVQTAGTKEDGQSSATNPQGVGVKTGTAGPAKSIGPPVAAADGVGGPTKTLTMHLESVLDTAGKELAGIKPSGKDGFVSIATGAPVAIENITGAVQNAISAIGAEAIAAMREFLTELAGKISSGAGLIASFTGIPTATMAIIKQAINLILSQLCGLDSQISTFINMALGPFDAFIESAINQAIDFATSFVDSAMDKLGQGIMKAMDSLLCAVKGIVSAAEGILSAIGAAKKIIDTWKEGSEIFAEGFDLTKLNFESFMSIVLFLFNLFDFGCNRKRQDNRSKAFVPFLGSTYCNADGSLGDSLGAPKCGSLGSGFSEGNRNIASDFVSQIYNDASPYLTQAETFMSGAWTQHTGVPGRQSTTSRVPSGTVHTSIYVDDDAYKKYLSTEAGKDEKKAAGKQKSRTEKKPVAGDHSQYANAYTVDVAKDLCYNIRGDEIHTIDGDYHLKVTGNFHLEVGGMMAITAVGAPQQKDANGKDPGKSTKIQKHMIKFESDTDISCSGGQFKLNATDGNINTMNTSVGAPTGNTELNAPSVNIRGGDIVLTANNTLTTYSAAQWHFVNQPPIPRAKSGVFWAVNGPYDIILGPAPSIDPIPRFSVVTPGPFLVTCKAGGALFKVGAGAFVAKVAAGAAVIKASAAVDITGGAAVTIKGATVNILGGAINLN